MDKLGSFEWITYRHASRFDTVRKEGAVVAIYFARRYSE